MHQSVLTEANELQKHAKQVIIVPKDKMLEGQMHRLIPKEFLLG